MAEEGEILEDDDVMMVYSSTKDLHVFEPELDNHEAINMEIESDSEAGNDIRPSSSQVDEADELRQLLLSQVKKKKTLVSKATSAMSLTGSSSSSTRGPRSQTISELSPRKEALQNRRTSPEKELLPPPPLPPPEHALRKSKERSRRDSSEGEKPKTEEGLSDFLGQLKEIKEQFHNASAKYEMARRRKRDYLESIAQCDATLAKYQRIMESLWEKMVNLSSESASMCLKGVKKMRSTQSRLNKTIREQKESLEEKDEEIEQLSAKNSKLNSTCGKLRERTKQLESIIRAEEAAVRSKKIQETTEMLRPVASIPERAIEPILYCEQVPTTSSVGNTENSQTFKSTSWRRPASKSKPMATRYFQAEVEPETSNTIGRQLLSSDKPTSSSAGLTQPTRTESSQLAHILAQNGTRQSPTAKVVGSQPSRTASNGPQVEQYEKSANLQPSSANRIKRTLEEELKFNPMLMFSGSYRLSPNFPFHLITHPTITNSIDPDLPLCPYMLNGRCADDKCPWQHDNEYRMCDEEIIKHLLSLDPSLRPRDTVEEAFISQQLKEKPVEELAKILVSRLPAGHNFLDALGDKQSRLKKPVPECADEPIEYEGRDMIGIDFD